MIHSDFKQWLLFQLMDIPIPDWTNFIAVNQDGEVFAFDCYITPTRLDAIRMRWEFHGTKNPQFQYLTDITLPDGYDWKKTTVRLP